MPKGISGKAARIWECDIAIGGDNELLFHIVLIQARYAMPLWQGAVALRPALQGSAGRKANGVMEAGSAILER